MYKVILTKQAQKDAKRIKSAGLEPKVKKLVEIVREDPFAYPPPYEPLVGQLTGLYSRRISRQHRFVYEVIQQPFCNKAVVYKGMVKILSLWTHYETL